MLVEFRLQNYRSFCEEQVFSLAASKDTQYLDTHSIDTGIKSIPRVLRTAAIYGANASGKSNLVQALQDMQGFVIQSASRPPEAPIGLPSFKFAPGPTSFETTFILGGARYQYSFTTDHQRVLEETLLVFKTAKPQRWFQRRYDSESDAETYEFGPGLKGQRSLWQQATRPNALFLSTAVQLNSQQLQAIYQWFDQQLIILNHRTPPGGGFTQKKLEDPAWRERILRFVSTADVGISNIELVTREKHEPIYLLDPQQPAVSMQKTKVREPIFEHFSASGQSEHFTLDEESEGTRLLLTIAGPILDILDRGCTLIVDELDSPLHTLLAQHLVQHFHRQEAGLAQMVFTTHNTALLSAVGLFRRDQIWFAEKDAEHASSLVALSEFSPRKSEAIERGYLAGRYGGVPFIDTAAG